MEVDIHEGLVGHGMGELQTVAVELAFANGHQGHLDRVLWREERVLHDLQRFQDSLAGRCSETVVLVEDEVQTESLPGEVSSNGFLLMGAPSHRYFQHKQRSWVKR